MKVKVGQDYVYKGKAKKFVHIVFIHPDYIEYKEYKSYKDKTFTRDIFFDETCKYMSSKRLFLHYYRPVNIKVRRLS